MKSFRAHQRNYGTPDSTRYLIRNATRGLTPYVPGLSEEAVRQRYVVDAIAKLGSNENPFGASPHVVEAMARASSSTSFYPDPNCTVIRHAIAETLNLPPSHLVFGNGSEEILSTLCRAFLNEGEEVIQSSPTFSVYANCSTAMGARIIDVPRRTNFTIDVDALLAALTPRTKLLFLCNPNNPTGTAICTEDFERLTCNLPLQTLLVVDEAYYEYARTQPDYPDSLAALSTLHSPWLVLRTFSKAYGLAGARIGYGICSNNDIAKQIDLIRTAFNVNQFAQVGAQAAWADTGHVKRSVEHNEYQRLWLTNKLTAMGLAPAASYTNFLFVDTGRASGTVCESLLTQGVIVKPWGGAYSSFIRVTVGATTHNVHFLQGLSMVYAQPQFIAAP